MAKRKITDSSASLEELDGVFLVMGKNDQPIAVQIDWEKYRDLLEDFFDVAVLRERRKNKETISLAELSSNLKAAGKL